MPPTEPAPTPKVRRQAALTALVRQRAIHSQAELAELLAGAGHGAVNQATLSRDLRELGIAKGPNGYVLPETSSLDELTRVCQEWLREAVPVSHQLVLKSSPGGAHPLALALDHRADTDPQSPIVGTLAGDDTVLVVCRTPRAASRLAEDLQARLP